MRLTWVDQEAQATIECILAYMIPGFEIPIKLALRDCASYVEHIQHGDSQ